MIMGSGKSTVVGPLLSWLVSNSNKLVLQVVPDPLLRQTRSVMQGLFGHVVPRRVQLFNFDRSPSDAHELNSLLLSLKEARSLQAIVCTTPSSLKCLLLKYVETLEQLNSASGILFHPKHVWQSKFGDDWPAAEKDLNSLIENVKRQEEVADILAQIIKLFKESTAVVDEVDWVRIIL
jgi:hypothetical protein